MGSLSIGRVTLPIKEQAIISARKSDGLTVSGWLEIVEDASEKGDLARAYRDDLLGHLRQRDIVPVVSDGVAQLDGYYLVAGVEVATISNGTIFEFSVELIFATARSWTENDVLFRSQWVGRPPYGAITNDFSITTAAEPTITPPVGHEGFDPGATIPASMTRALASGDTIRIYRDVALDALGHGEAIWSVAPEDYYIGAAAVERI